MTAADEGSPDGALTEDDVRRAFERMRERGADAVDAEHVYETLTWGEGPSALRLATLQDWLWYRLATRYMTTEVGHMDRLTGLAAEFFDELGLEAYADECRSDTTVEVQAAWLRSDRDGRRAMRKAFAASPITPADLDDFVWSSVMGIQESGARLAAEDRLESALLDGELVAGARGWRSRQGQITAAALDSDHPELPGQSWRSAVLTERVESWVDSARHRSDRLGRRRAAIANRLLHPIDPPEDLESLMAPLQHLLELFGEEQALTQNGYLNRRFVLQVAAEKRWEDELLPVMNLRSESDFFDLHDLRHWLQGAGALRRSGKVLRRTKRGVAMMSDPVVLWERFTTVPAVEPWERFVLGSFALAILERGGEAPEDELIAEVRRDAADLGWRTHDEGDARPPSRWDVFRALRPGWRLLQICGLGVGRASGRDRPWSVNPAGESTLLAVLRHEATGPRHQPI